MNDKRSQAQKCLCRDAIGGEIKYGVVKKSTQQRALVDRGNVTRYVHLNDRSSQIDRTPIAPPRRAAGTHRYAQTQVAQRAHVRTCLSGSNLPRASHGSNSWSRNTPSPGLAKPWANSQIHKPQKRSPVSRPKLVWQSASSPD
jgi:hypothetical protein